MKQKTFLISSILLLSQLTWATTIANPKCKDLEKVKTGFTPQYLAVIDGYNKKGMLVDDEVDVAGIVSQSNQVESECAKNKSAKIKNVRMNLKTAANKTTTANPTANSKPLDLTKAKCSEFVALGEQLQPVAAFWVAGNIKHGKKHSGEVDEMFLERPVTTLVQDCTSSPTASFYEKAKLWFNKESKAIKNL